MPLQDFAVSQSTNPYQSTRLLLDGQQRLTSLSAVIRGEPVSVRGRRRPIDLLFNLEHPDQLAVVTEVEENGDGEDDVDDDSELIGDETDSTEDELLKRFNKMTFVVATRKLEQLPHWVKVSEVFKTDNDAPFLKRAGISGFDDSRYEKYSQRLARLRGIRKYVYRMDVLERTLSYDEVTEIFVRVNSLGAKLRSSDLALAQITAKWRHSLQTFQDFQRACAKTGFDLDLGLHLKNLMAFATGQSRFQIVGSLNVEKLQKAWKEACDGMEFGLNFLRSNLGIDSPALLSSPFLLVVLAYFGHSRNYALSNHEARQLRYWALMANARPLLPRLQRNHPGSGFSKYSSGRSGERADRPAAPAVWPSRYHRRGTGRPKSAQRVVQDHVPGFPRCRCERLAQPSDHFSGSFGRPASLAVPSHLSQSRTEDQLHCPRGG